MQIVANLHRALGTLRRIVAVVVIVIFCGANSCAHIDGWVQFAPGYGYVIEVVDANGDHTYFVFSTREKAEAWAQSFNLAGDKIAARHTPGFDFKADEDTERDLYEQIEKVLRGTPGGNVSRTIDRVVPPMPTAPAPQ